MWILNLLFKRHVLSIVLSRLWHSRNFRVLMKAGKKQKKENTLDDIISDCNRRNSSQLNQIRFRAKQKQKFESLCSRIEYLQLENHTLQSSTSDFYILVQSVKVQAARARLDELDRLYTLFEFGMGDVAKQMEFVQDFLKSEIGLNGQLLSRHVYWNQFVLLSTLYSRVQFEIVKVDVCGLAFEIVHVMARVHLQLNRTVLRFLYPSLNDQLEMEEFLVGKHMVVDLNQVYYFDGPLIQSINTDCDWVRAWRNFCTNYKDVWMILKNANIDQHFFIHLKDTQIMALQQME